MFIGLQTSTKFDPLIQ